MMDLELSIRAEEVDEFAVEEAVKTHPCEEKRHEEKFWKEGRERR